MPDTAGRNHVKNLASRGLIVTGAGPNMWNLLNEHALPTFRHFAHRWNYEVRTCSFQHDGHGADRAAQRAKWSKVGAIREALHEFPLVLWLDADVVLTRFDEDIAQQLHPDHFQALALEHVPFEHRVNPNTGVWLMRSCAQAFAFLDAVEEAGPQPGPWADQGAVLAALGWRRGDLNYHWAAPGMGTPFALKTSWLSPSWNQPYLDDRTDANCYNSDARSYAGRPMVPFPHAVHFMGMTAEARETHMRRCSTAVMRQLRNAAT